MGEACLGDLLQVLIDHRGRTPKKLGSDFVRVGVPVVSAINIKGRRIVLDSPPRCVTQGVFERWMPTRLRRGDVLLTSEAPLGEVALVKSDGPLVLGQRLFALRGKPGILDNEFLFYLLQWEPIRNRLISRATGTTVTGIRQAELVRVSMPVLPLPEQRAIAEVLGALDAKIEANRLLQSLLDRYLMLAYRSSLEAYDTTTVEVGDLMEPALGGAWGSDEPASASDVLVSCLRGIDLSYINEGKKPNPPLRWLSQAQFAKRTFGEGEIWLEGSGSFCGRSLLVGHYLDRWFDHPVRYSNFVKRLIPKKSQIPSVIVWLSLRAAYTSGLVHGWRTGTAFPNLDIRAVLRHVVTVPPPAVLRRIASLASASLDPAPAMESSALGDLRDALLPRLLSGELRVREAEALAEEAL